jgi:nucleotide-binding universal stress UspA family protein
VSDLLILATDQSPQVAGALRYANELAAARGLRVEVVSVVEPIPIFGASAAELAAYTRAELEQVSGQSLHRRITATLAEFDPQAARWPVVVEVGTPAPTIVQRAQARGASLIVLGLGRHALADRWLGSETALRVMRLSHVPVLAVPADAEPPPKRVVVATDFTELSLAAARNAIRLTATDADVHLAHVIVQPSDSLLVRGPVWLREQEDRVVEQLGALGAQLRREGVANVETHVLDGDPAGEVLHLARRLGADLIAAGSHGTGFFGRILMGSVSTRLVRQATCAVLVAPPTTVPQELQRAGADVPASAADPAAI